ncbi:hypothetical protein T261_7119 [Streptomyces lydicus]|nr:hypothetical protein T261_7119 [Streptomyces lydicus]
MSTITACVPGATFLSAERWLFLCHGSGGTETAADVGRRYEVLVPRVTESIDGGCHERW